MPMHDAIIEALPRHASKRRPNFTMRMPINMDARWCNPRGQSAIGTRQDDVITREPASELSSCKPPSTVVLWI